MISTRKIIPDQDIKPLPSAAVGFLSGMQSGMETRAKKEEKASDRAFEMQKLAINEKLNRDKETRQNQYDIDKTVISKTLDSINKIAEKQRSTAQSMMSQHPEYFSKTENQPKYDTPLEIMSMYHPDKLDLFRRYGYFKNANIPQEFPTREELGKIANVGQYADKPLMNKEALAHLNIKDMSQILDSYDTAEDAVNGEEGLGLLLESLPPEVKISDLNGWNDFVEAYKDKFGADKLDILHQRIYGQELPTNFNQWLSMQAKKGYTSESQRIPIVNPSTGEVNVVNAPKGRVIVGERQSQVIAEQRRQMNEFARSYDKEQIPELEEGLGLKLDDLLMSGRARRLKDGRIFVLDKATYDRNIEEGKFTPTERQHVEDVAKEYNAWARIVRRLNELGVKEGKGLFEVTFENTKNPMLRELGIFSIPARFEVARQFKDDPRLAAVARDIELAFQLFRTRVTGAQASDKEIERLRTIIAKLTDQPQVFFQTVSNFMENADEDFNIILNVKEMFGRDVSEFRGLLEKSPSLTKGSNGSFDLEGFTITKG